ncbi:GNAT family N-acetyltransferase [Microbacterium album]|uniref:N-acetyltransferase domain-containing protein n=1 Tax=Microbacterium album TaxID=2053191 RepID=A0A917MLX9_9MICO|nr:GNAT family N-acetyltransferase [Microbacterium album]GGH44902.1 hypothetical protein GCM10010921_19910 [Microbacterium album]
MHVSQAGQSGIGFARFLRTVVLDWRNASGSQHRAHLSVFRCTQPEDSTYDEDSGLETHDYPWEYEVQDYVRRRHVPAHPPEFLLLGYDDKGLAAVIEIKVSEFDRFCFIAAVAIAQRVSGRGLAAEALARVHNVMTAYRITSNYTAMARIDPDNWPAKSAFAKQGYEYLEIQEGYELWARNF